MSLPSWGPFAVVFLAATGSWAELAVADPSFVTAWKTRPTGASAPSLAPLSAQANDSWEDRFYRSGIDGPAFGLISYQGKLIAGGAFLQAGEATSRYVAAWDGMRWTPMGIGMNSVAVCFVEYQGALIAGGNFQTADGSTVNHIARWDGNAWVPLGEGTNGPVWALTVHEGKLVAGGLFSKAGNAIAVNLATWDGVAWSSLGDGPDQEVLALLSRPGELVVAGSFEYFGQREAHHVLSWDGTSWRTLGTGLNGQVVSLAEYGNNVVAGGSFQSSGESSVFNIAAWDGSAWTPLGEGTNGRVDRLLVHDGRLFAAGQFSQAGGGLAIGIAAWDGGMWTPVGNGLNAAATSLAVYQDAVFVAGEFQRAGDGVVDSYALEFLAELRDGSWGAVVEDRGRGMNDGVNAVAFLDGQLVVGGNFTMAGNVPANFIARWNGRSWEEMGGGFNQAVLALKVVNGVLYAGGTFFAKGDGIELGGIARWDGAAWQPMGFGFNRWVFDIEDYYGTVVVGGNFTSTGGRPVNRVCYWDGDSWRSMGTGMTGTVSDLAVHKEVLYVGGSIAIADIGAQYLARWNTNHWEKVDHPFDFWVSAITSYGGELIAGGDFRSRGGEEPIRNVARWDGTVWRGMGEGFNDAVNSFTIFQGNLVALGQFAKSGDVSTHGLASWDRASSSWQPFGSGVTGPVPEIITAESLGDRLVVGGYFNRAGGRVANNLAAWSPYEPAVVHVVNVARTGRGAMVTWSLDGFADKSPEFDVYRETENGPKVRLTAHPLWGETEYRFTDTSPPRGGASYWIAELDRTGSLTWHGPAILSALPVRLALAQNIPNPFAADTRFSFDLPSTGPVRLAIHDLSGREVVRVLDASLPEGTHEATWTGKDRAGNRVAAGIYVARLSAASGELSRKLLKLQ